MNTQVKHTPGPWEVNKSDKCLIMVSKEISPRVTQPIADVQYNKERYANAHLIAAAPAMYEALLSILPATDIVSGQETDNCRWCGRDYTDHAVETGETLELCSSDDCPGYIARAALAQAEGTNR